jgi:hypothetical protein
MGSTFAWKGKDVFGVSNDRGEMFHSDQKGRRDWTVAIPPESCPKAVILAGEKVIVAAMPDADDATRGEIWVHSAADGRRLSATPLPGAPRFDALAAVPGSLFVGTRDGRVLCLGGSEPVAGAQYPFKAHPRASSSISAGREENQAEHAANGRGRRCADRRNRPAGSVRGDAGEDYPVWLGSDGQMTRDSDTDLLIVESEPGDRRGGIVSVYNERTILSALERFGYPRREARTFANDGCRGASSRVGGLSATARSTRHGRCRMPRASGRIRSNGLLSTRSRNSTEHSARGCGSICRMTMKPREIIASQSHVPFQVEGQLIVPLQ